MSDLQVKSPYYRTQLDENVPLYPDQIGANFMDHLLTNLRTKVERKCVKDGYVMKIIRIVKINSNRIDGENFTANGIFNVTYDCFLCSPVKDMIFTCKVQNNIGAGFIDAVSGPIRVIILLNDLDGDRFEVKNNAKTLIHKQSNKHVNEGIHVVVLIKFIRINAGENFITVIVKLIDLANEEQTEQYENDLKLIIDDEKTDDNQKEFI
jgi:DNA-directed RNA polymerase subunit E'/Rpb7